MRLIFIVITLLALSACDSSSTPPAQVEADSPANDQIAAGKQVFQKNCLRCHGADAVGLAENWKKRGPDGNFPPPPLNGTGHAWHHSMQILRETVDNGGVPLGGVMPGFKDQLSEEQKTAVLAYIQSLWPEETLKMWKENNS